ncbi:transketolase [Actinotalea sp. M2MS4P-6]|uniref:transketolase n=1 Tax=Actinotalea sp. M2MS4P-6 TaxID=2983762 RepID=UPI0021E37046|nr:transketolase [Actinotalea sp. M2MS4P-6]MCV2395658.1 transketolase [Actinotalea sp. M2MS4P-6]
MSAVQERRPVADLALAAARARRFVLRMLEASPAGHVGGALSAIDLVTALYTRALRVDPDDPRAPGRDRFLLSAGHKALAQYAVLALTGFFPPDLLDTYGATGSALGGHPDMAKLPGIEANTGALGHGLPLAVGMALGLRRSQSGSRVVVLLGDGELAEGSNWEGAAVASHHRLSNLVAIVDVNGLQIGGPTAQVMGMEPIAEKFRAFGWVVTEVDGHDLDGILDVLDRLPFAPDAPSAIIATTCKGKGITAIEGTVGSHYWKPSAAELADAVREADAAVTSLEREVAS